MAAAGDCQVRATVAYDGTEFSGFQWQPGRRTVQGAIEEALGRVGQPHSRVTGAGRTDAGVHARGQVIGFHVAWNHGLGDLQRALNAVLPPDVVVADLRPAEPGWHARFSATQRHYRYLVLNQPVRSPLDNRYAAHVAERLEVAALREAAECLPGEQDFGAFGQPTQGESTVRRVISAGWQQDGDFLRFDVVGNAFLRGMVRRLVGCMLLIGNGYWPAERMRTILESRKRSLSAPPAPARGLCLMRVDYELGARLR